MKAIRIFNYGDANALGVHTGRGDLQPGGHNPSQGGFSLRNADTRSMFH